MTKRILSVIPARGGSKGFPRKNIANLAGIPLIAWTIKASLNSKYITKTIVSSDDKEILEVSIKYGAEIIRRPDDLANDTATSESVVKHAIDYLKSIEEVFDIVILLQPTSPFRDYMDIDNAFEIMFNSNATATISVFEFDNKILKNFEKKTDGFLKGVSNNKYPFMRRQDLPSVYMPNGAIYIIKVAAFEAKNSFFTDRVSNYLMPQDKSLDIDCAEDFIRAESILNAE